MPGILWLASYPKSGNTWLRVFLANLFRNPAQPIPINDLPQYVLGDGFLLHYEQFSGRAADQLDDAEISRLRPKVHNWMATSKNDTVLVKTHSVIGKVDGVPLITPEATSGAIYVTRNPLDLAVSYANHLQVTVDRSVEMLCNEDAVLPPHGGQVAQYLSSWSKHVTSWLDAPGLNIYAMRYEDMTAAPMKAFGNLVQFLGLPKDLPRIKKAIQFSSFDELKRQESKEGFVEARPDGSAKFFRKGQVGDWRDALSDENVATLIETQGEVMRRLGYLDANGNPVF